MDIIQMTRLGKHGRWGNCLFQSAFLQIYAQKYGLSPEAPMFPGQELLPFRFAMPSRKLRDAHERTVIPSRPSEQLPPIGNEYVNRDFCGYAQFRTTWYAPYRDLVQRMWTPSLWPPTRELSLLRAMEGRTCIGLHYRAGDYITLHHNQTNSFRPPKRWYLDWLDKHWQRFRNPLLLVAVEEPRYLEWFRRFSPVTAEQLGLENDFISEWTMLSYCDVLLIPNSTFSFTASMASQNLQEAWRATLPAAGFERYDPWNDTAMRFEQGKDYSHLKLDADSV